MKKIALAALLVAFVSPAFAQTKPMTEAECKKITDAAKQAECMKKVKK
ncbi:MAG: hypothetical protein AB7G15_19460 [Alphaproteobacteria bacterium]